MSESERDLLQQLTHSRRKLAELPVGFDLGVVLTLPTTDARVTGAEPILIKLDHPAAFDLPELERQALVAALAKLYPEHCREGKFLLPVGAEVTASSTADVIGERFGALDSKNNRSSFVVAMFQGKLNVGRIRRFVQFQLQLPSKPVAEAKDGKAPADAKRELKSASRPVTHNFVQVLWYKPVRDHTLAPEFYLGNPYPNLTLQWLPVHRLISRVGVWLKAGPRENRTFVACLLPCKVSLLTSKS